MPFITLPSGMQILSVPPVEIGGLVLNENFSLCDTFFQALAPPQAPTLNEFSIVPAPLIGVSGKLSYGASIPIAGVTSVSGIGTVSPASTSIDIDQNFVVSGNRIGIFWNTLSSVSGILNSTTPQGSGSPYPAYAAHAFFVSPIGNQGSLNLYVNNDITPLVSTGEMYGQGAFTSTNANGSGFNISTTQLELFPSGTTFSSYGYRTGTWIVNYADLQEGWNWIRITLINGSSFYPSVNQYYDFVIDKNTTATSFSGELLGSFTPTAGSKYLSGVKYYIGATSNYSLTINNLYRNTYSNSSSAVSYGNNGTPLQAISSDSLPACAGSVPPESQAFVVSKTATIVTSGTRLIPPAATPAGSTNGSITVKTTALRTVQNTAISSGSSINNILLDNVSASSTTTFDGFDDEVYRLPSTTNFDLSSSAVTGSWTSSNSIADTINMGYEDGLQVINSKIIYPYFNYDSITNGPHTNVDYSGGNCTGIRTYYRFFDLSPLAYSNFSITINGNATPRSYSYSMTDDTNDMQIAMKLPNSTGFGTGWMDAITQFATGHFLDGDGCLLYITGSFVMNNPVLLTVGTKSTGNVNNKVFVRIQVPYGWTGSLNDITLVGA